MHLLGPDAFCAGGTVLTRDLPDTIADLMKTRPFRPATAGAALVCAASLALAGCSLFQGIGFAPNEPDHEAVKAGVVPDEPPHVVVQHVLIAFEGADIPGATRTRDEAGRLAKRVLEEARRGRPFPDLVRLYSDDRHGDGTYALANWGVPAGPQETDRQRMVRGFGNLAFTLAVGEFGVVEHDPQKSPFGWHVMKRLK
jgi:hypothetical protein